MGLTVDFDTVRQLEIALLVSIATCLTLRYLKPPMNASPASEE